MDSEDNISVCSQVEEVIKCAICWETPKQPKVLPCQHTFCLRCIQPVYLSNVQQKLQPKHKLQCPLCRNTHHLTKKGVVALPTDHKVNVLGDIVQKKRHLQGKRFCVICTISSRYTLGTYFCVSCGSLLCSKCYQMHRTQALYEDHLQIPIFTKKTNILLCADHPKEFVHYYCTDCEIAVCEGCTHGEHSDHRVVSFVSADSADIGVAQDIHEQLNSRLIEIPSEQEALQKLLTDVGKDKMKMEDELEEVRSEIEHLKQREEELSNLAKYYLHLEGVLEDHRTRLEESEYQLTEVIGILQDVVFPLSNLEQVTISYIPLKTVQKVFSQIKLQEISVDEQRKAYNKFRSNPVLLLEHLQKLESDTFSIFSSIDEAQINSSVKVVWQHTLDAYDVQFVQDGSRGIVCTGQELRWKLHMLSFGGEQIDLPAYLQDFISCECRVISNPVTSTVTLTHRSYDDGLVLPYTTVHSDARKTAGSILTSRDQNSLCSFTVTRNNDIVFTFMDNKETPEASSMRCHGLTGDNIWHLNTGVDTGSRRLCTPYYVITDYLDRLIVSDHTGEKISIFDNIGNHLLSFPKEKDHCFTDGPAGDDDDEDDVPKPSGICVDSKNNIFVAFPSHQVVTKFTPNGDFVKHAVFTNGKPRGISLDADRYLAVGVHGEGVYLYDLSPEDGSSEDSSDDGSGVDEDEEAEEEQEDEEEEAEEEEEEEGTRRAETADTDLVNVRF